MNIPKKVNRSQLGEPGYHVIDAGIIDAITLRQKMIDVAEEFHLEYYSVARFNQQFTTKFHQDGGPIFNILILGYEPSEIRSRFLIADHVCAANDFKLTPQEILSSIATGDDNLLKDYTIELPQQLAEHSRIVILNNSLYLGVLHKAIIATPDQSKSRIINSLMLSNEPGSDINIQNFIHQKEDCARIYS